MEKGLDYPSIAVMNLRKLTFLVVLVAAWAAILFADNAEQVLSSSAKCDGPDMILEVQLDAVTLSKMAFPFCHAQRGIIAEEPQESLSFYFKPKHAIIWMHESGAVITAMKTKPDQVIDSSIRIWRADADSDWLIVGVSFYSDDKILMNRIHIAHLGKRDRSEIAAGLVLLTYPRKVARN